jgi:hypothetical protein
VPDRNIAGKPLAARRHAENVRMYARSIEDVPALDHACRCRLQRLLQADDGGILGLTAAWTRCSR